MPPVVGMSPAPGRVVARGPSTGAPPLAAPAAAVELPIPAAPRVAAATGSGALERDAALGRRGRPIRPGDRLGSVPARKDNAGVEQLGRTRGRSGRVVGQRSAPVVIGRGTGQHHDPRGARHDDLLPPGALGVVAVAVRQRGGRPLSGAGSAARYTAPSLRVGRPPSAGREDHVARFDAEHEPPAVELDEEAVRRASRRPAPHRPARRDPRGRAEGPRPGESGTWESRPDRGGSAAGSRRARPGWRRSD